MKQYLSFSEKERLFLDDVIEKYVKKNFELRITKNVIKPTYDDFWMMPWGRLNELREKISSTNIFDVIQIIYDVTEEQFLELEILNVFSCYKWIISQIEIILQAEKDNISSEMSEAMKEAGAEELIPFGIYNSLRLICPDLTKQEEFLKLPYAIVFRELAFISKSEKIKENYNEIITRKNRRPS